LNRYAFPFLFLFTLSSFCTVLAQTEAPIQLANPSFEEDRAPRTGIAPQNWFNCGDPAESPPDIQPGAFSVIQTPSKGATCLGLVVRDNNTSEGIAQRLQRPLESGKCYEWSLDVCRSKQYLSLSKKTNMETNYNIPVKVRLWGGNGFCDRTEMLFETPLIEHHNWKKYTAKIQPKKGNYSHIILEVDFDDAAAEPYNGNILIDNLSAFSPVRCLVPAVAAAPKPTDATATTTPTTKPDLIKKVRIRYEVILFDINSDEIKPAYETALQEIANYIERHPEIWIEISGHTSNNADVTFAQSLSLRRARAVAAFFAASGAPADRIYTEGFGKTQPVLPNYIPESRVKNQRVEITIWQ